MSVYHSSEADATIFCSITITGKASLEWCQARCNAVREEE